VIFFDLRAYFVVDQKIRSYIAVSYLGQALPCFLASSVGSAFFRFAALPLPTALPCPCPRFSKPMALSVTRLTLVCPSSVPFFLFPEPRPTLSGPRRVASPHCDSTRDVKLRRKRPSFLVKRTCSSSRRRRDSRRGRFRCTFVPSQSYAPFLVQAERSNLDGTSVHWDGDPPVWARARLSCSHSPDPSSAEGKDSTLFRPA